MPEESKTPVVTQLVDLIPEFVADAEAAALAKKENRPRGIVSRLSALDEAIGGYFPQGIHILQGAPGSGKTAFALQMAGAGFPCLYVSTEMGLLELFRRIIARETNTFLGKLKSGELSGMEAQRLALQTAQKVPYLALMDATQAYASSFLIKENAGKMRERFQSDYVLIVIDSLQYWARSVRRQSDDLIGVSEYDLLNKALDSIASIASKLRCPVLAVSQRNRTGNKSDGGLHAGKGSGDLEYIAETVIDLTRRNDKDKMPDFNGEVEVTATLHKNRHGIPGISVPLKFSGRLQRFREI